MRNSYLYSLLLLVLLVHGSVFSQSKAEFLAVGAPIADDRAVGAADSPEAARLFEGLKPRDTVQTVFRARVVDVCQAKGCWMRLALPEGEAVMVRFKDYGFFVPKDIAGQEVVVSGEAFISEVSEEERRHLAADAGKPEAEIRKIRGAAREPGFEAAGVRIYH